MNEHVSPLKYIPGDKCRAPSMLLYKDAVEEMGCKAEDCAKEHCRDLWLHCSARWNKPPHSPVARHSVSKQPHYTVHQAVNRKGEALLAQPSLEHHCPHCEETEKCLISIKPGSASVAEVSVQPLQIRSDLVLSMARPSITPIFDFYLFTPIKTTGKIVF